ncbi:MAG: single-stranded-DNA-specific exonuclease RecJ [Lachnospiraceae bacterium]|nr:single-stranded-DNA-specific exonuclease RecJ [Lachnospiraceae bacterium]MDY5701667.1 single-stranded-DNA-specific exonuclease RecJ [Lachnospiraceae bacterium]
MAKWFVSARKADFEKIGKTFGISPVLARIIRNREIIGDENIEKYLHGNAGDFYSPALMKDMDRAAELLWEKIRKEKRIRVIGDYDVDGICSTCILKKGLEACGARVDTVIPHRIKDGYGINEQLIKDACEEGIDTLITCDNGIAAREQLAYAASLGITCIVTDHHEVPYESEGENRRYLLPQAAAIVNPKQEDCPYPNKNICGAGIAWKLVIQLWESLSLPQTAYREILELAAVATVCDVMVLLDENRILVKEGLNSMAEAANPGLEALFKVHDIQPEELSAYHLGFVVGPCLNATGRLDTAKRALELLECKDKREAIWMASELKKLNESRKEMTEEGVKEALRLVEQEGWQNQSVIVVYLPDCHESLAGIIAGRLKERYYKPVFVLTPAEDCIKGSGRSIEGYHMYEEMSRCKELFLKFGGHKLAAGLSILPKNIELLRRTLNENCNLTDEDMEEKILIDVPMPLSYVTLGFLDELKLLEPFGMGNPKPVFAQKNIRFLSLQLMGKNRNMARFSVEDEAKNRFCLVLFRGWEQFQKDVEKKYGKDRLQALMENQKGEEIVMNIIYYPSLNTFRGRRQLQFILQNWN